MRFLPFFLVLLILQLSSAVLPEYTDVFVPDNCDSFAQPGDHVLVEFELFYSNGTVAQSAKRPDQLVHFVVQEGAVSVSDSDSIIKSIKGMCKGGSRRFTWSTAFQANFRPIISVSSLFSNLYEPMSAILKMDQITRSEDYAIFDALKANNSTLVLDMIDAHIGVNSVDAWGQTPLMIATVTGNAKVIAALLNARRPSVDVNMARPSGATALFSAIEHAPPMIVQALLRRGADPNLAMISEDSFGNTPLHYACLLERTKHAELLLDYGANPFAVNKYQNTPLQLLPSDIPTSSKLYFRKIFEDARAKWNSLAMDGQSVTPVPFRHDL